MAIKRAAVLAILVVIMAAGTALATHTSVGLTSTLLGRGSWDRAMFNDFRRELRSMRWAEGSDVAVVKATLAPGGTTDWHGHPGPSVVVVTAGTIRVLEPTRRGGCRVTDFTAGQAFFHEEGAHNFVNPSSAGTTEFLVTYFAPAGPLLVHEPNPGTC